MQIKSTLFLLLLYFYFNCIYLRMKEGKKVLSIQTDQAIIDKLKDICVDEKRSQAKTIEVLIEEKHATLKKKK